MWCVGRNPPKVGKSLVTPLFFVGFLPALELECEAYRKTKSTEILERK